MEGEIINKHAILNAIQEETNNNNLNDIEERLNKMKEDLKEVEEALKKKKEELKEIENRKKDNEKENYNSIRDIFDKYHPYRLLIKINNKDEENFEMITYNYNIENKKYKSIGKLTMNKELLDNLYKGKKYNTYYSERKYEVNGRGFNIIKEAYNNYIKEKLKNNKTVNLILYDMKLVPYTYKIYDNKVYHIMDIYDNDFDKNYINKLDFINQDKTLYDKHYQLYNYLKKNNKDFITISEIEDYKDNEDDFDYIEETKICFKYYLSYKIKLVEDNYKFDTINANEIINNNILKDLIIYHCLFSFDKEFYKLVNSRQNLIYNSSLNKYYKKIYKEIQNFKNFENDEFKLFDNKIEELAEYLIETFNNNNNDTIIEKMYDEQYYSIVLYNEFKDLLKFYKNEIKDVYDIIKK